MGRIHVNKRLSSVRSRRIRIIRTKQSLMYCRDTRKCSRRAQVALDRIRNYAKQITRIEGGFISRDSSARRWLLQFKILWLALYLKSSVYDGALAMPRLVVRMPNLKSLRLRTMK